MKYIGNKTRLLDFIHDSMKDSCVPSSGIFIDIFSGTTSVAQYFKKLGYSIISNDFMTYSYVFQRAYIKSNLLPKFICLGGLKIEEVLHILNSLKPIKGYAFNNYAPSGINKRQYFSNDNAMMIDAIRDQIETWKNKHKINQEEFYILLACLIDAADFVANMSGTYGAYLKIWRSMALKKIELKVPKIFNNKIDNQVFQEDSNILVRKIKGDIIYIDPPYNARQYAPNFHVLESIAVWDKQDLKGKTGLRDYSSQKSLYSLKGSCTNIFEDLVKNINAKFIVLSYNNEGIISRENILQILESRGQVMEYKLNYRRFRTERNHEKRQYKDVGDKVCEHLYVVKIKK